MSFSSLINALAEKEEVSMPVPEAQAMELIARWESVYIARSAPPLRPAPGILVTEKRGLRTIKASNLVFIVWRLLDENNRQDWEIIRSHQEANNTLERVNCIVAFMSPDGAPTLVPRPHSLSLLDMYPHGEK